MGILTIFALFTYFKLLLEYIIDFVYIFLPDARNGLYIDDETYMISSKLKKLIDEKEINVYKSDTIETVIQYISNRKIDTIFIFTMTLNIITMMPTHMSYIDVDKETERMLYSSGI